MNAARNVNGPDISHWAPISAIDWVSWPTMIEFKGGAISECVENADTATRGHIRRTARELTMQERRQDRWPILLAVAASVYLVFAVFWPILGFEFVDLDVDQQVTHNPHIRGLTTENLKHIFTSRCVLSYYPIRTLSFAVDYQLWGLDPGGFKLTNCLIHLANVLLVFWLVLRLFGHPISTAKSPGRFWDLAVATFSAGIFAVHPVVVEPVTWVAGREELLMTLGALGCIHFYLTARRLSEKGGKTPRATACFFAAAVCCAAACLSNAVAAVIPALIVAYDVLTLTGPKLWKILRGTLALWVIGIATVVIKLSCKATWTLSPFNLQFVAGETGVISTERLMLIPTLYWLNLRTLAWPTDLTVHRAPLRPDIPLDAGVILGVIAIGLTCVVIWALRRRKLVLLGLAWFGLALAPASQIMPHHMHQADRFLYLPMVGLMVAMGISLRPLGNALKGRGQFAGMLAVGISCLFLLVRLSADQVQTWRDRFSMWEHCVSLQPDDAMAHDALASILRNRGESGRAMYHFERAMELDNDDPEALSALALHYATCEDDQLRDCELAIRLARRACELTEWKNRSHIRTLATVYRTFADSLAASGEAGQALENYKLAIRTDPEYDLPFYNLALLLATCEDQRIRNPENALRIAQKGRELTEHTDARHLRALAGVYAGAGRFEEAISATEKAISLAEDAGNSRQAAELRHGLKLIREQTPARDSSR